MSIVPGRARVRGQSPKSINCGPERLQSLSAFPPLRHSVFGEVAKIEAKYLLAATFGLLVRRALRIGLSYISEQPPESLGDADPGDERNSDSYI
jgi:hypothetical protein